MPLEVLDDVVVPIAEVGQEVAVAEQVAHHHRLMSPHLRIVCSHLGTSQVVHVPGYRRRWRWLVLGGVVLVVRLVLASGCQLPL